MEKLGKNINRRSFVKKTIFGLGGLLISSSISYAFFQNQYKKITPEEFSRLPSPEYKNVFHNEITWEKISKGLEFSRTGIYRNKKLIDIIASVKINPEKNKIKIFNGYSSSGSITADIEHWQKLTNAQVMINSAQYQGGKDYYKPCALTLCNQVSLNNQGNFEYGLKKLGPIKNKAVRGMLVSEPKNNSFPKADLLDFDYDKFDYKTTPYTQGVQHWPILLDRQGRIKVKSTLWQANRTLVAKTKENEILFMTTEGGYFTLYNLGQFLRDSNNRKDKGFDIQTAMNLDGGYEAEMIIKTKDLEYLTYGQFETYGIRKIATIFNSKMNLPGVIGVFSRD